MIRKASSGSSRRWLSIALMITILPHPTSIFSNPFLSTSGTFTFFMRDSEATFHVVNDALDNEFVELLLPAA